MRGAAGGGAEGAAEGPAAGAGTRRRAARGAAAVALLFAAVSAEVVWSWASMHLGALEPSMAGHLDSVSTCCFYLGYLAVALVAVARPGAFGPARPEPSTCAFVAALMVASTVVWSFSYGQALFDPAAVRVAGALLCGLAGGLGILVCYPAAFACAGPEGAAVAVVGAHLVKRLLSPALGALGIGSGVLLLAYVLPAAWAAALVAAGRVASAAGASGGHGRPGRGGGADGGGGRPGRSAADDSGRPGRGAAGAGIAGAAGADVARRRPGVGAAGRGPGVGALALLLAVGLGMVACDAAGAGAWSLSDDAGEAPGTWQAAFVCAFVAGGLAVAAHLREAPLGIRFLPALALALVPAMAAATGAAAGAWLADASQTLFHGMAWVATFACAREAGIDVHRASGVAFVALSVLFLILGAVPPSAAATVLLAVTVLAVASGAAAPLAAWLAGHPEARGRAGWRARLLPGRDGRAPARPGAAGGVLAERGWRAGWDAPDGELAAAEAEGGAAGGSPDGGSRADALRAGQLRAGLLGRCAEVAARAGLSAREEEVLVLLVQGWGRQDICDELGLSEGTVKTHASHIYAKLGIAGRQGLAAVVWGERSGAGGGGGGAWGAAQTDG